MVVASLTSDKVLKKVMLMLKNADDEVKFESWKVLTSVFFLLLYYRFIFDLTLDNLECLNEKK